MTEFDPAAHRMVTEQRWFEDFILGERFVIPSRTMTSAVFAAFQTASGDSHPVHYDVEYCRARGRGAVSLSGGAIAGRFSRAVEPVRKAGLCRRHDLPRARSDGTDARPLYRRRGPAQHRVQSAPRAGAGGDAEVPDPAAAGSITSAGHRQVRCLQKARKLRLFADIPDIKGCRDTPPALPVPHEIP